MPEAGINYELQFINYELMAVVISTEVRHERREILYY